MKVVSVINTAVLPVAGLGTRFLPITKSSPKEMLPIIDQPLIQYVVDEAVAAGIKKLVFVTCATKRTIEDYFDSNFELEYQLKEKGKYAVLSTVQNVLPDDVSIAYVRQKKPMGLGDAVLCAKTAVGNEPFAVLLPDDIMANGHSACLSEMISIYKETQSSVLGVQEVPWEETNKYGIVSLEKKVNGNQKKRVQALVEKPSSDQAPSNLAIAGRYILTPEIFDELSHTSLGAGNEIQLTDAISKLLEKEFVTTSMIKGKRYDCGSRIGFLKATIDFSLKREALRTPLLNYLKSVLAEESCSLEGDS